MLKELAFVVLYSILTVGCFIGAAYLFRRSVVGPGGSIPLRSQRIRRQALASLCAIAMIFSGWRDIVHFGRYTTAKADNQLLVTQAEEPEETEETTTAGGSMIDFDAGDMIPYIGFDTAVFQSKFGSIGREYKGTSLPTTAQFRQDLTRLYFDQNKETGKCVSDAVDISLWMPIANVVYSECIGNTGGGMVDLDNTVVKTSDQVRALKDAHEKMDTDNRMKADRLELYARIIGNPMMTEAWAKLLVNDVAAVNNKDRLQSIIDDYEAARKRTRSDSEQDGRGIGTGYWVVYAPGYDGDMDHMIVTEEQFNNGAFVCSVLEYYVNAEVSERMSSEHWKHNCAAEASQIAPVHVTAASEQENMISFQMKYYEKSGNGRLVSWIGANEADARPMRFPIKTVVTRKVSETQAATTAPETTTAPEETTTAAAGDGRLRIVYRWADNGPAVDPPAPAVSTVVGAGNRYHVSHPSVKGATVVRVSSPQAKDGSNYLQAVYGEMTAGGATWYVYYKGGSGSRRPGSGGGSRPTEPSTKPDPTEPSTQPSTEPDTKPDPTEPSTQPSTKPDPTDPSPEPDTKPSPTDPSPEPDTKPDPTKPSPDGQGGKDPAVNPAPEGNAPTGGGDANGGPGSDQDKSAADETTRDYPEGESERESREDATQASREENGKGDTTGTSNKVKEDPTVSAPDDAIDSKGENPPDRTSQEGTGSTGIETTTTDNGDGTSTTTESKTDTGNEEVSGTLGDPTDRHTTGGGSAAPESKTSNDITPDRSAAPAPEAAPAKSGAEDNDRGSSSSDQSSSGSSSGGSDSGSGSNSNDDGDGDGDGDSDNGDISPQSDDHGDSSSSDNGGDATGELGAPV